MKIIFTLCLLSVVFNSVNAQEANTRSYTDSSYWQVGLSYQNDNIYLGRKDSTRLPYISPSIGYYHKSGLFIDASLSYLTAQANQRIDLVTFEGGYHYMKNNFEAQISGTKYFYNSASTSVKSEVKGSLDAYTSFDFDFLKPSFEVLDNFSTKSDINLSTGLEHTFYSLESKLDITPSIFLNAGTQNYFGSYFNKRKFNTLRKKKNSTGMNYTISAKVTDASSLKLLDYEITVPVNYTYNKFSFNFTPSYAIPVNPANLVVSIKTAAGTEYSTTNRENLSNSFYYTFGVAYNFK